MPCEESIKFGKVASFLVIHVFHQGTKVRVSFGYWRRLGSIYECRG